MEKNKSLINILNEKGPRIEPCGTTVLISQQELNDEPILVLRILQVRQSSKSLKLASSTP